MSKLCLGPILTNPIKICEQKSNPEVSAGMAFSVEGWQDKGGTHFSVREKGTYF